MPSNHLILCPLLLLPSVFPSIRVFPNKSALHISDQSIGASALSSVLSMSIQDRFPLELTGLVSLQSKGLSRVFSSTTIWKHQFFSTQPTLQSNSQSVHYYWKNHSFNYTDFCHNIMCLVFNMLTSFGIAFLAWSKRLLISWLQAVSAMIMKSKKIKFVTASTFPHLFALKWWDRMPWFQFFACWV